ncbi:MAG: (Fe-S)-binding protein [Chloroflexi bacterium]|nr:(Fe-S)-binding protein [Chloroflexota bacterium]
MPRSLDNFSIKQLLELDACTRCGACVEACDAYAETQEAGTAPAARLQESRRLLKAEHGLSWLARLRGSPAVSDGEWQALAKDAFRCTLCGRCGSACPVTISLRDLWLSMRQELVCRGLYPEKLDLARDAIRQQHNVVNYPNEERAMWVDYMAAAPADGYQRPTAEMVYFVGCVASFSPAVQSIPEAFVQLLTRAGIDFTILGEREYCCGFPLLAAGMRDEMEALKRHNIETIRQIGAKTVTFTCPSCYNTWVHEYGPELPDVELVHSTQLLARLIGEGRLKLKDSALRVTYHDPCDLGRNSGEYEAPRRVLEQLPGGTFLEVQPNRAQGLCCGGGGDLEIADPTLAGGMAGRTLGAFEATGAEVLVTACQQCKRMFQAARDKRGAGIGILDIAELVLRVSEETGSDGAS